MSINGGAREDKRQNRRWEGSDEMLAQQLAGKEAIRARWAGRAQADVEGDDGGSQWWMREWMPAGGVLGDCLLVREDRLWVLSDGGCRWQQGARTSLALSPGRQPLTDVPDRQSGRWRERTDRGRCAATSAEQQSLRR
jgi:hypothetical protein